MIQGKMLWTIVLVAATACLALGLNACGPTGGGSSSSPIGNQTQVFITGTVSNASNSSPIPSATVTSSGQNAGTNVTTTDANGFYQLSNGVIPFASYPVQVVASAAGFSSLTQTSQSSTTATLNFALTPLATETPTSTGTPTGH